MENETATREPMTAVEDTEPSAKVISGVLRAWKTWRLPTPQKWFLFGNPKRSYDSKARCTWLRDIQAIALLGQKSRCTPFDDQWNVRWEPFS